MTARLRKAYRRAIAQPIVLVTATNLTPARMAEISAALRSPQQPIILDSKEESFTILQVSCKSWARLAAGEGSIGEEACRWLAAKGLRW